MPRLFDIHWLPDGPSEEICGSSGEFYCLPDGTELELRSMPVWCYRCGDLSYGEEISQLSQLDDELRDLSDRGSELFRFANEYPGVLEETLADLRKRRMWRASRKSPAKCLECGSSDLELPLNDQYVTIRGSDRSFKVRAVGMCRTQPQRRAYTPEGDRIKL